MIKILFQYVGFYLSEEDEGHYTAWHIVTEVHCMIIPVLDIFNLKYVC